MSHLHIQTPNVVHETIEGEVVIVNLDKGLYFSIDGVGAAIWTRIAAGVALDDIRSWFTSTYGEAAAGDLEAFAAQLTSNELATERDDPAPADGTEPADPPATYRPPTLEVYSDMEELLLLDPIHEVDDAAGWPHAPA